jgi:multiple sugar transport system permease protein
MSATLNWRLLLDRAGLFVAVVFVVSPALLVLLWMLSLALKSELENSAYPPVFVPAEFSLQNFTDVIGKSTFFRYLYNSIIVSGLSTLIGLMLGVPAGYGIARAKANKPGLSYLIPLFILFRYLDLIGTLIPMVLIHLVITLPITIWVMIGFFETLPQDLEEAATIDGCGPWQAFWHIALPLSRPGIMVATILSFIFSWNNFVFGVVLTGRETRTLPVAVYNSMSFEQISWGPLAASALIVTLPVLILTIAVQKEIVHGLTAGGLKGG